VRENDPEQFDRLPATADERVVEGRATREAVLDWWEGRFGLGETLAAHTFWERGAGKVWAFAGDTGAPAAVETLGMAVLRTRQEYWKPTTDAAQRFGDEATRNVLPLDRERAARFVAGEDQKLEWDGDWGYVVVATDLAGLRAPLGVGLYVYDELKSMVPKGRRRELK
jgi:NOL1/NOP2/fmu family ribosome biogenesis protein